MTAEPAAACLLRRADQPAAGWESALDGVALRAVDPAERPALRAAVAEAACAMVDAGWPHALDRALRARRADDAIQIVVVAPAADRPLVERAILFASGLGEVWIVAPEEVGAELVGRAAAITRTRRRYRATQGRLVHALATIEPQEARRAVVSDAYLASLLDASPDPILSVDAEGAVISWSPGAERVLGHARAEVVGKRVDRVLGAGVLELIADAATRTARAELRFLRKSGEDGVGECIVVPVDAGGHRVWAVILHDQTEQRAAQDTLEAQAAELEAQAAELETQAAELQEYAARLEVLNVQLRQRTAELERTASARSRFYAAMSHELRTPINAIIGFNALVLDGIYGELPDAQREALQRAQRAANHLLELVNDVLDLAKIEAGRVELRPEPVEFPILIEELLDTVRSLAETHGSAVSIRGDGTHRLQTDPRRLRQILLNLLSNAIKFGGGEPIDVAWRPSAEGGLVVDVVDRGRGIAAEHLDRIFEEFTQLEPNAGDTTGTGLGLPISRQLARLMGGTLEASSAPGRGSTFRLTLPAAAPQPG